LFQFKGGVLLKVISVDFLEAEEFEEGDGEADGGEGGSEEAPGEGGDEVGVFFDLGLELSEVDGEGF
jgi:hypothetical protein